MQTSNILFVTDFDGTLTTVDTSYLCFRSTQKFMNGTTEEREDLLKQWKEESVEYYSGYTKLFDGLLKKYTQTKNGSRSIEELLKLLVCLDEYNLESRRKLAREKYFNDILYTDLDSLITQIVFHPNALETVSNLQMKANIVCKILSVNWFPQLLQHSLKGIVKKYDIISSIPPIANKHNEVNFGEVSTCIGKKNWIADWKAGGLNTIIYVGDSLTDLAALLEATYGIIFGYNEKIHMVAMTFDVKVIPLVEILSNEKIEQKNSKCERVLYVSENWGEIEKFVTSL